MSIASLQQHLQQSFQPGAATGIDAVLRLQAGAEQLTFRVRDGTLDFAVPDTMPADATFMFTDLDTARALLSGRGNAFDAFMAGHFRSDGYLMWAFALMAMFGSASLPATPVE
jgi:putative sterol carrier protein